MNFPNHKKLKANIRKVNLNKFFIKKCIIGGLTKKKYYSTKSDFKNNIKNHINIIFNAFKISSNIFPITSSQLICIYVNLVRARDNFGQYKKMNKRHANMMCSPMHIM